MENVWENNQNARTSLGKNVRWKKYTVFVTFEEITYTLWKTFKADWMLHSSRPYFYYHVYLNNKERERVLLGLKHYQIQMLQA